MTALYRLMAVTAAQRRGLTPTCAHLERPSVQVDGRDPRGGEPDAQVIQRTRGDRRDHRPDLHHVRLDLMVEHHAGIALLMKPRSGNSSERRDVGQVVTAHVQPLQATAGTPYLVADRARYRAENRQQLADTGPTWIPRVPATLTAAQHALEQASPEAMFPLKDGYRDHVRAATSGGVAQRWRVIYSEPRRPQARRTVDTPWYQQSEAAANALPPLCRTACAWEADAAPALAAFTHHWRTTTLPDSLIRATPRDSRRGRPGPGVPPAPGGDQRAGALASSLAAHEALVAQQRWCILATNALDDRP